MPKSDPRLKMLTNIIKEDIRIEDEESCKEIFISLLGTGFGELTDVRQASKVKHYIRDCIAIILFCAFSDVDEWIEMEYFAKDNIRTLKKYLELPNGIPSHDTLERVMSIIDSDELQNVLVSVLRETIERASKEIDEYLYKNEAMGVYVKDVVAIDGKETIHTGNERKPEIEDQRNFNMLNVYSTEYGIALSSTRIDEKTNEIPETQKVLKKLNLKGCVVTADALNTQKETAKAIVDDSRADYCLAVKGNHATLYNELIDYFSDESLLKDIRNHDGQYLKQSEETTYKEIIREHYITDDIGWYEDRTQWKSLQSFAYVKKTIKDKETGEISTETRYFICSFKPIAKLFSIVIRRHWHVENLLHWMLDVVFKEDRLRTREKNALENLALVKRFVLSILKVVKSYYNMSFRYIRRKIGRNLDREIPVIFAALKKMYASELSENS